MVISGYSVDLYCDCDECKIPGYRKPFHCDYAGENWTECKRQAKKDGWKVKSTSDECYAPGHKP